ncbi:MAG: tetratricopeptide repeat protein [Anaerolineae bacterium]
MIFRKRSPRQHGARWHYNHGIVLYRAGQYRKALHAFARAIRLGNDMPGAHAGHGLSLAALGRPAKAIRHLEKAMALQEERQGGADPATAPWFPEAATACGQTYEELSQWYMALRCYTKALRLLARPEVELHRSRARVHLQLDQGEQALEDLNQALELEPDDAATYYYRAQAHERLGHRKRQAEDLQRFLALADADDPHRLAAVEALRALQPEAPTDGETAARR